MKRTTAIVLTAAVAIPCLLLIRRTASRIRLQSVYPVGPSLRWTLEP